MVNDIDQLRSILIVIPDQEMSERLAEKIQKHIDMTQIYFAKDGIEGMAKIANATPHIVFVQDHLPKRRAKDFVEWILTEHKSKDIVTVILSKIPDKNYLVDEVVLGKVHFLENCDDDQKLGAILSRALNYLGRDAEAEFHLRFLAPGETLIKQGEVDRNVFLVRRGELQASCSKNGTETSLGQIKSGEFVGEMAYINGEPRSANVKAETDCELIEIPANHLDHVLFQKPSWSKALVKTLSQRLKRSNSR